MEGKAPRTQDMSDVMQEAVVRTYQLTSMVLQLSEKSAIALFHDDPAPHELPSALALQGIVCTQKADETSFVV